MARKIIQIAVAAAEDQTDSLYALCDDGSLWLFDHLSRDWYRLPSPPTRLPTEKAARPAAS